MSSIKPPKLRILISGAGIAGNICAFWLAKYGHSVEVIELFPTMRTTGQQIDLKGAGQWIVQRMGLEADIKAKSIPEKGVNIVDVNNTVTASYPVTMAGALTADIEILRGQLSIVLYEAAQKQGAKFRFGKRITDVQNADDLVSVTLQSGETKEYDLLIVADGLRSSTRTIAFGDVPLKSLDGQHIAYFSIPATPNDVNTEGFARAFYGDDGKGALVRPDGSHARVMLSWTSKDGTFDGYWKKKPDEQKSLVAAACKGLHWEEERLIGEMLKSDDFYMDEMIQVQMPSWYNGRCVAVGDAAYCPSTLTGLGTTCAAVGAHILSQCIVKSPHDLMAALRRYDAGFRPFVERAQSEMWSFPDADAEAQSADKQSEDLPKAKSVPKEEDIDLSPFEFE